MQKCTNTFDTKNEKFYRVMFFIKDNTSHDNAGIILGNMHVPKKTIPRVAHPYSKQMRPGSDRGVVSACSKC